MEPKSLPASFDGGWGGPLKKGGGGGVPWRKAGGGGGSPEERLGMADPSPAFWNLSAVIWVPLPVSSCVSAKSSFCLVIFLLMVHSHFSENSQTFFIKS